jgi:hypothetical protein
MDMSREERIGIRIAHPLPCARHGSRGGRAQRVRAMPAVGRVRIASVHVGRVGRFVNENHGRARSRLRPESAAEMDLVHERPIEGLGIATARAAADQQMVGQPPKHARVRIPDRGALRRCGVAEVASECHRVRRAHGRRLPERGDRRTDHRARVQSDPLDRLLAPIAVSVRTPLRLLRGAASRGTRTTDGRALARTRFPRSAPLEQSRDGLVAARGLQAPHRRRTGLRRLRSSHTVTALRLRTCQQAAHRGSKTIGQARMQRQLRRAAASRPPRPRPVEAKVPG